ncbi:PIG-L family deacetylase [Candidatus Woesearchaeota archaeon]|nr:PIG-L family deacetylase [Candidatus Woesearchaeota archaeon]
MKKKGTVVCICAHPDDQIFGPGGTLAKYAKEGKKILTIILSYGEFSHPHFKQEIIAKTRVKESEDADKIIGGSGILFLGLKEGKFRQHEKKTTKKLTNLLHEYRPKKILTHASDDPHPDHRATFKLVKQAYDRTQLQCPVYTFDVWTPFSTHKRDAPYLIVDVSKTYKTKLKALSCFESQLGVWGFLINIYYVYAGTLLRNFIAGIKHGHRFAEVFYKLR